MPLELIDNSTPVIDQSLSSPFLHVEEPFRLQ